jgi:bacterioferritin
MRIAVLNTTYRMLRYPGHVWGPEEVNDTESKGRKIVGMDVNKLLELLNKAFADEWLAYYQYWVGAKVVKGPMRRAVVSELEEHAGDEHKHAGMLAERIIQLGGTPILKPEEWYKLANCGYDAPEDPSVRAVVEQNVKGEQCAIDVYKRLLDTTRDKDEVTSKIVLEILDDEVEHEADLQTILEDIDILKKM